MSGLSEESKAAIANLTSEIAASTVASDTSAYRGVDNSAAMDWMPGDLIEDRGFVSASLDKQHILDTHASDESRSLIVIKVPAGAHALEVKGSAEKELIIQRGSTFRVVSNGDGHITLELVNRARG